MSFPLEPGRELEPFVVQAVDAGRMKTMAVLLRDPNPIHWDERALGRLGMDPRPVNQGPISASYLMELAIRAAGSRLRCRTCDVRFLANVLAGQHVICTGRVMAVNRRANTADLELAATADGVPVLSGSATVILGP